MPKGKIRVTTWGWIYEEWNPRSSASRITGSPESPTDHTLSLCFTERDIEALTAFSNTLITDGLAIYPTVNNQAYANGEAAKRVSTFLPLHVDLLGLAEKLTHDEERVAFAVVDLLGLFRLWRRHVSKTKDLKDFQVAHDSTLEAVAKHAYIANSPMPPPLPREQTEAFASLIESCRTRHPVLPSQSPSKVSGLKSVSPKTPAKPSPLPARHGEPWSKEDNQLLVDLLEKGLGITEIARRLQRTIGAISSQLEKSPSSSPTGYVDAAKRYCGNCGERTTPITKFCIYCGADQDLFEPENKS